MLKIQKFFIISAFLTFLSSCFPFIVADNLLIIEATVEGKVEEDRYDVYLYDKDGREMAKRPGVVQGQKLTASFVITPYNEEYFVVIMRTNSQEKFQSKIFSTSGGKTVIDLENINISSK